MKPRGRDKKDNRGRDALRGVVIYDDTRCKQKVIEEYFDLKCGCYVKVLEGVKEVPFLTVPTGYET